MRGVIALAKTDILPKLPYGRGAFSWGNEERTIIIFQRPYKSKTDNRTYRLKVRGGTVKECYTRMQEKEAEKEAEIIKNRKFEPDKQTLTLSEALNDWLANEKNSPDLKAASFDRIERTVKCQILKYPIASKLVLEIKSEDIQRHLRYLQFKEKEGKGLSISTLRKTYEAYSQFFRYFYKKADADNPMREVQKPTEKRIKREITFEEADKLHSNSRQIAEMVLDDAEIRMFREACYEEPQKGVKGRTKYGMPIYLCLVCFLRVGELCALTWGDVDFQNRMLRITKSVSRVQEREEGAERRQKTIITTPKTSSSIRQIPLTDEALNALRVIRERSTFKAKTDFVVSTDSGSIVSERRLMLALKSILEASGLNENGRRDAFTLHFLRHTGISAYIRHGVPLPIIAKLAGHASSRITERVYVHVIEAQKREAVNYMNNVKLI